VQIGPVPEVPRKSSKRNSSTDRILGPSVNLVAPPEDSHSTTHLEPHGVAASRLPFDRTNSQRRLSSSTAAGTEDFNQLPSAAVSGDSGDERPTSYGYVNHHNISRVDPSSDHDLLGSAAEVVNGSRRVSPGSSASGRS
jgi:hypothetical protein